MSLMSGGKAGGKNALAAKPNLLNALQVQTSSYGQVIPILYGQNRIAGRLLWSGDFQSIAHTSTQKVGGKGLGSGGGNVSQTSYTYQTAVAIALCMGPVQNLGSVWDTKGQLTLLTTSAQFTVPGSGGSFTPPADGRVFHSGRGVSRADSYSINTGPGGDYGSDGSLTLTGSQQTPMVLVTGSPGPGQYTLNPSTGQHTFSSADTGKVMTITYAYSVPDSSSNGQPQTKLNLTLFTGQRPQTPWSYLTSVHPGQDLGYSGIAYVASSAMDLGSSGALPNLSYEVLGLLPFGGGTNDAEPSAIISDLINNPFYGLSGAIALDTATTLLQYRNFCIANGIFLSPVLDAQKPASQWIQEILDVTNAAAVWSEGVLKIRSYGDTTAVGNGATFTPTTNPIYDLDSSAYLDVVSVKRPSAADVMNAVSVEFVDRSNSYNVAIAEDKDEAQIAIYGLRKDQPKTAHSITSSAVAAFVANLLRKRQVEIRNTYSVKVGWQYALLEPMDLVTLTIPELGYTKKPVRILAIREDDTGQLEMDCEDFPWGTATPTLYAQQVPTRFSPQTNADPGNVNPPIIFEAPVNLSKSGQHEIWMAVSGSNVNWGGAHVWVSQDNSEYHQVGTIVGAARMGVLTGSGTFGITGDPYTGGAAQTFDLTQSNGTLISATQADADSYRTLMWFDGEFISYAAISLVAPNVYDICHGGSGGYVRRGLFGSNIASHGVGVQFARLDDAIFTYVYDPSFVGKTIYLKFTSFNTNGMVEQSIANATAYQFMVTGKFCQMETVSKNLLSNPGFETNQNLTPFVLVNTAGARFLDGWLTGVPGALGVFPSSGVEAVGGAGRNNSQAALLRYFAGASVPNASTGNIGISSDPVPITPGETYSFGAWVWHGYPALPAGVSISADPRLGLYDASGAWIGELSLYDGNPAVRSFVSGSIGAGNTPWTRISCYDKIATSYSGKVPAFARLSIIFVIFNSSGTTYTVPSNLDAFVDDCWLFPQWTPAGDEIAKVGSISVTYSNTPLSYSDTPTSITWSWNFAASRTDLAMTVNNYSSSQAVTGLNPSTDYYFYPFIDEVNQVVNMVATAGVGTPSWAHTSTALSLTQEQSRSDHWPLSTAPVLVTTPANGSPGGSGSGGGGIGGPCLRHDVLVRERTGGVIAVRDLAVGDWVSCPRDEDTPDGWAEVTNVCLDFIGQEWVHTFFNCDDWLATTTGHPFTLEDGAKKRAAELSLEDPVPCLTGVTFPISHALEKYPAPKVGITIRSRRHVFYAGMKAPIILQHNIVIES